MAVWEFVGSRQKIFDMDRLAFGYRPPGDPPSPDWPFAEVQE
jgi:hypothetical protein